MTETRLKIGDQATLALPDGTIVARIAIKKIIENENVIASIELEHTPAALQATELLTELAQACTDFAFGAMAAAEGALSRLGVRLLVGSDSLELPVDFCGLVILEELHQISFRLKGSA